MKYSEMSKKQKELRSRIWIKHLDMFCPKDMFENRPCDWGCLCDKCQYDYGLNLRFVKEVNSIDKNSVTDEERNRFKKHL